MSFKVIRDAQNGVIAYGPDDAHYEPSIPAGCILSIEQSIPGISQSEQFKAIERALDAHIDSVAKARGYERVGVTPSASCIGYAGYANQWQAEAIKFGQWVESCWSYTIQERAKIVAGTRLMPTPEQAVAELPGMVW